jgi:hypothetical protein
MLTLRNCIVKSTTGLANYYADAVTIANEAIALTAWNNVMSADNTGTGTTYANCLRNSSGSPVVYLYNNTCWYHATAGTNERGLMGLTSQVSGSMKNNLFYSVDGEADSAVESSPVDEDYNAANVTETNFDATNDHVSHTFSFVSVTDATDLHLASNDTGAIDLGADLSGTFTTDIDGQTRTGTWDIGADEMLASGSPNRRRMGGVPWLKPDLPIGVHVW